MSLLAIFVDRAFTPRDEITDAAILVDGGKFVAVGQRSEILVPKTGHELDLRGRGLTGVPGFVDVHIHGAGGHDVMEGTPDALRTVATTVTRRGTTSLVATTVTTSEEATCRAVSGIASYMEASARQREGAQRSAAAEAEVLGVHFEGPFISPARRGVHPPEWIVLPSVSLLRKFLSAANGAARIITLAPELPGSLDLISAAREAGVVISMGHTDATFAEASAAIASGARHAAHMFNAMRPFGHRETGVIGAVLTSKQVTAELIADGVHVDAAAMQVLLAAKGAQGVILVSDGTSATGMPDGAYRLGTFEVNVKDGVCRDAAGNLAGSTLTLDRALRNMLALGVPFSEALGMLTTSPARLLGLGARKGVLAEGADADLVLLDAELGVAGVMTRGVGLTGLA